MFLEYRKDLQLTRGELSEITGRSINYILKAEQGCFPSAPAPLLEFYSSRLNMSKDEIRDAYRGFQRYQRSQLFEYLIPNPYNSPNHPAITFRRCWLLRAVGPLGGAEEVEDLNPPSQYALSKLLCVPASAIYYSEKYPRKPLAQSVVLALSDVREELESGRAYRNFSTYTEAGNVHSDFERIWRRFSEQSKQSSRVSS